MRYPWSITMSHSLHFNHVYETEIPENVKFISPVIALTG